MSDTAIAYTVVIPLAVAAVIVLAWLWVREYRRDAAVGREHECLFEALRSGTDKE